MLSYLSMFPPQGTVAVGANLKLSAIATYAGGGSKDVTSLASWASGNTSVVKVGDAAGTKGSVTGISPGTSAIYATYGGQGAVAQVTVPAPTVTVVSVSVAPATAQIAVNAMQSFTATASYSDATTGDVTKLAAWSSAGSLVATVSSAPGSEGVATGKSAGKTTIVAAFGGKSGNAALTVTVPVGPPSAVGTGPCSTGAAVCAGPAAFRFCITDWGTGYCTVDCTPDAKGSNLVCPAGSTCYQVGPNTGGQPARWYCLRDCVSSSECTPSTGTTCFFDPGGSGKGACLNPN